MKSLFKPDQSRPAKILILRALPLQAILCTVPAFRALRSALPDANITLLGMPWASSFVKRFNMYLDDFIAFPGFPGFPEQIPDIQRFPQFLTEVQHEHFDLVLQMQGPGHIANSLVALMGGERYAGFYHKDHYRPEEGLFLPYPENETEVWRHLRLMEFLEIPLQGDELEFPLFAEDLDELSEIRAQFHIQEKYICIHPGTHTQQRRSPMRFVAVVDRLADFGYQILLTGTQDEADATLEIKEMTSVPVINLAGKTSLGALAALVAKASLLISNDTGVSHLAAALKTPSLVLLSGSDPRGWAHTDERLHKVIPQAMDVAPAEVAAQAILCLRKYHDTSLST